MVPADRPESAPAWDCHAHVFGDPDRYPLWHGRSYEPPAATLDDYLALLDGHDIARGVLVQPSVYGFDNRCLLDALDRARGRLLGVAVPPPDATAHMLEMMHNRGVRGVRCNLLNPGGLEPATVIGWQPVLRALDWHVEVHIAIDAIPDLPGFIQQFGVTVVIDHMGRPAPGRSLPSAATLHSLIDLVRRRACFVKLSAPYRLSNAPPPWRDVAPLARALLEADPAACVWASDWPHVDTKPAVNTVDVLRFLDDSCSTAERSIIMAAAPRALYGN